MGKSRPVRAPAGREAGQGRTRWFPWAVLIGALIVLVMIQGRTRAALAQGGIARVGRPAPDFTLRLFNGKTITLSSLKGKPVLVNFWHSG